jgi:ribose 1,5-bisphosphokinase
MKGRLIYIVGPSGSGKDSVIGAARARLGEGANVVFARRTITRPAASGGEDHIAATEAEFEQLLAAGAFAMHWRANGLAYGIGREILGWLDEGRTVVVSGSREHLPRALAVFPAIEVVLVTATPETLRRRLVARGRETPPQVEARIARAGAFALPSQGAPLVIENDGALEDSGRTLAALLQRR